MFKTIKEKKENNKLVGYTVVFKDDKKSFVPLSQNQYTKYIKEWVESGGVIEPFEMEAEKEARLSKELLSKLMELCDTKQIEAQKLILGEKATPLQLARYDDKYARAKDGEFEDAVNQAIITAYETARSAIRNFVDLIELYRSSVDDLIKAKDFDKAKALIEAGRELGADTAKDDIVSLLGYNK